MALQGQPVLWKIFSWNTAYCLASRVTRYVWTEDQHLNHTSHYISPTIYSCYLGWQKYRLKKKLPWGIMLHMYWAYIFSLVAVLHFQIFGVDKQLLRCTGLSNLLYWNHLCPPLLSTTICESGFCQHKLPEQTLNLNFCSCYKESQ